MAHVEIAAALGLTGVSFIFAYLAGHTKDEALQVLFMLLCILGQGINVFLMGEFLHADATFTGLGDVTIWFFYAVIVAFMISILVVVIMLLKALGWIQTENQLMQGG